MFSFRSLLPLALVVILASTAVAQAPARPTLWGALLQSLTLVLTQGGDGTPPAPPSNLSVVPTRYNLKVKWNPSPDDTAGNPEVTSYDIRRGTSPSDPGAIIGSLPAARLSLYIYRDKTITSSGSYYYWVKAIAPSGESPEIGPAVYTATAPQPPSNLTVVDDTVDQGHRLTVRWTASPDDDGTMDPLVTEYLVRRAADPTKEGTIVGRVPAIAAANYTFRTKGESPFRTSYFWVRAITLGAESPEIGPVSCRPTDELAPLRPTGLSVTDPVDNGKTLNLSFNRSGDDGAGAADVIRYYIYRMIGTAGTYTRIGNVKATGAATYQYQATGLTKNTLYQFTVTAYDGTHESLQANPRTGTPRDEIAPQPPSNLACTNPGGGNLDVTFNRSPDDVTGGDVTSYKFFRATEAAPDWVEAGSIPATRAASYNYRYTGLTPATRYHLGVAAFDGDNLSTIVDVWGDNQAPGPVTNLQLTDVAGDEGTALTISFNRSSDDGIGQDDVVDYLINWRVGAGAWAELMRLPANNSPSYSQPWTGLTRGLTYSVQVQAYDGFQYSTVVTASGVPLDDTPPAPPRNLAVADWPDDDGTSLRVTFDASLEDTVADPETIRYDIYRATSADGPGTKVGEVIANQSASYQYRATGLTPLVEYWLWACAVGDAGPSAPSNKASGIPVDTRPVRPPLNLTAADRPYDNGGVIDLGWDRSGDDGIGLDHVAKYYIYRRMANVQTPPEKIGEVVANNSTHYTWADTTVPMELILYEYTVTAVSVGLVESVPAGPVQASSENNNVVVFQPPTNFTVADVPSDAGGQLLLTWNRSTSENDIGPPPPPPVVFGAEVTPQGGYGGEYDFYRRTASGSYGSTPTFIVSAAGTNDPMTYVDVGLTNGVRYYYKALYRRYNQISNFTPEVSAIPVNNQSGGASVSALPSDTPSDPGGDPAVSTDAALSVQLVRPPSRIPAGQDALLTVAVRAPGPASVALQYSVNGGTTQRTEAQHGVGSFSARIALPTGALRPGSVIRVRAVATSGGALAASEVATILVR